MICGGYWPILMACGVSFGQDNATAAAIKCIKKTLLDSQRDLLRVKSEFSCWRAMSGHPNVIQLLAFLETESHWCFVMEYADLGSLSQILRHHGSFIFFFFFKVNQIFIQIPWEHICNALRLSSSLQMRVGTFQKFGCLVHKFAE